MKPFNKSNEGGASKWQRNKIWYASATFVAIVAQLGAWKVTYRLRMFPWSQPAHPNWLIEVSHFLDCRRSSLQISVCRCLLVHIEPTIWQCLWLFWEQVPSNLHAHMQHGLASCVSWAIARNGNIDDVKRHMQCRTYLCVHCVRLIK